MFGTLTWNDTVPVAPAGIGDGTTDRRLIDTGKPAASKKSSSAKPSNSGDMPLDWYKKRNCTKWRAARGTK